MMGVGAMPDTGFAIFVFARAIGASLGLVDTVGAIGFILGIEFIFGIMLEEAGIAACGGAAGNAAGIAGGIRLSLGIRFSRAARLGTAAAFPLGAISAPKFPDIAIVLPFRYRQQ